jgi:hypothetical protein
VLGLRPLAVAEEDAAESVPVVDGFQVVPLFVDCSSTTVVAPAGAVKLKLAVVPVNDVQLRSLIGV